MMPDPNPTLVSIRTTEGPTSWTSLTYSDCSLKDDDGVLAAGLLVAVPHAARNTASMMAAVSPVARLETLVNLDIFPPGHALNQTIRRFRPFTRSTRYATRARYSSE